MYVNKTYVCSFELPFSHAKLLMFRKQVWYRRSKRKKIVTLLSCCAWFIFGRGLSMPILGRNVKQIQCRRLKIIYKIGMNGILSLIWNSLRIYSSILNIECNDDKCLTFSSIKGRYPLQYGTCSFAGQRYASRNVWSSFKKPTTVYA